MAMIACVVVAFKAKWEVLHVRLQVALSFFDNVS